MGKFRTAWIPLLISLLVLVGAACGSDDSDGDGGEAGGAAAEQEPSEEETEAEPTPEETGPPTIVMAEFHFKAPTTLPAGETTFQVENAGKQPHAAIFVELLNGKTIDDVNAFIQENGMSGRPPKWAKIVRGAQGFAKPGKTGEFTAEFTPGTYAMLCPIPDRETKKAHAELGMTAQITFE